MADVSLKIAVIVLDNDLRNLSLIRSNSLLGDESNPPTVTVRLVLVVLDVVIDFEVSVLGFLEGDTDGFFDGDVEAFRNTSTICKYKGFWLVVFFTIF